MSLRREDGETVVINIPSDCFFSGGVGAIESGQMPPGVSLIKLRPGSSSSSGNGVATHYALAYVWTVLA